MDIWQAIVLGIVQGLTEFLPISSSGHLIIFPWLLDWETPGLAFDAALHLGTLAAVIVYFRREILRMIGAIPHALSNPVGLLLRPARNHHAQDADARLGILIVIATLPGLVLGVLFEGTIDDFFHTEENSDRAIATIATMLIVVGLVLYLAEQLSKRSKTIGRMAWLDALIIGGAQALALVPGTSRSGATITAGLFRGLTRADAARFSFLAGMPLILGAGLKSVAKVISEGMSGHEVVLFIAGGLSAAIVGFLTIWGLLRFLERRSTFVFVVYRILFGLCLLAFLAFR
jgi:undecaprenyl-diphosphatase